MPDATQSRERAANSKDAAEEVTTPEAKQPFLEVAQQTRERLGEELKQSRSFFPSLLDVLSKVDSEDTERSGTPG